MCKSRVDSGTRQIATWAALKKLMRTKFVPVHHKRELFQRLQTLSQGSKSVDEYFKSIELALMRTDIDEDEEATMARFMGGLNQEIAHLVELHNYESVDEMVQMAQKIEKQLKRKSQGGRQNSASTPWKPSTSRTPWQQNKGNSTTPLQAKPSFSQGNQVKKFTPTNSSKGNTSNSSGTTTSHSSSIQCFRCLGLGHIASHCPNQKTMIILDDGTYVSEEEEEDVPTDLNALNLP